MPAGRPKKDGPPHAIVAVRIPQELKDQIEDIAEGTGRDITEIVLSGTKAEIERIVKEENKGRPFPPSKRRLRRMAEVD